MCIRLRTFHANILTKVPTIDSKLWYWMMNEMNLWISNDFELLTLSMTVMNLCRVQWKLLYELLSKLKWYCHCLRDRHCCEIILRQGGCEATKQTFKSWMELRKVGIISFIQVWFCIIDTDAISYLWLQPWMPRGQLGNAWGGLWYECC